MNNLMPLMAAAIIGAVLVLCSLIVLGLGWLYIMPDSEPETTINFQTTTYSTSTTSTSTSSTTSTSTSSTTSTSTLAPFYVCEKAMSETENIVTQCISRDTKGNEIGQWKNESIRATVYYELLDDIIDGPWGGNSVKAISERCVYAISDMSMAVSQLKSCVKPIGRQKTVPARLVNP